MDRNDFALVIQEARLSIGSRNESVPPTVAAFFTISAFFVGQSASVSEPTPLLFGPGRVAALILVAD